MRFVAVGAAFLMLSSAAHAEHYLMITHTQGTDPFWPVVEKAGKDAAAALGVDFEYKYAPSGDMADMAKLIEAAAASNPDGLIVSLPDYDALGPSIKKAVESGIPVVTINSGLEHSKEVGAIMHIGQPESVAGHSAGERAKKDGVTHALCLNQEAFNTALADRCSGYFDALGEKLNMIDVSSDPAQIKTRTAAALQADPKLDGLLAVGSHVCEAAAAAVQDVGAKVHLDCFDLSPGVTNLIKEGKVDFTVDQQQYLQGYLPVVILHLYNTNAHMLPFGNIPSGPGFVDKSNAESVAKLAGVTR
ncbi:sugar ABC transporter substrate-binding protein [Labrys okinawensis]|uniref:sugar ABC transporter substrate-binding protein n=1 Tax=Labrys okinawensis TaxID=346911 RepID=UPI0039BD6F31